MRKDEGRQQPNIWTYDVNQCLWQSQNKQDICSGAMAAAVNIKGNQRLFKVTMKVRYKCLIINLILLLYDTVETHLLIYLNCQSIVWHIFSPSSIQPITTK